MCIGKQLRIWGYWVFAQDKKHYFQYVEGRNSVVAQLLINLKTDARHHEFQVLASGAISFPKFSEWSMGYGSSSRTKFENRIAIDDSPSSIIRKLQQEATSQLLGLGKPAAKSRDNHHVQPGSDMLLLRAHRLTDPRSRFYRS